VKEVYLRTFRNLIKDRERETGFKMPYTVESYCVHLLAERVENNNLIPEPSFAEKYLTMFQTPKAEDFRQFGDDCLFFTAILPEYGNRRGLSKRYYCDLGISSYHTCGDLVGEQLYKQLGDCFYELQEFLESTIKNRPTRSLFNLS